MRRSERLRRLIDDAAPPGSNIDRARSVERALLCAVAHGLAYLLEVLEDPKDGVEPFDPH